MKISVQNFTPLFSNQIHTLPPCLVEIHLKMTKLCYFNQDNPHFSAFRALYSPVVCWWLWKEPVCWWWQMDSVTADAWSDHHWQPQPHRQSGTWWSLPPPCWRVLVPALPKWSARRLSTHLRLRLRLEFMVLFQHGALDVIVQSVQIWRAWGPLSLLNKPICIQSVLHEARTLRNGGLSWLIQHNFVIFQYTSTQTSW